MARLYGRLLKALGVLPNGKLEVVARRDLVGPYIGHTATVFEEAHGGVLFIEEAYPLTRTGGTNADFGQEAIDTLVEPMEDHRAEVAVIVPGYTAEMRQFLDNNLGLTSRFARTLEFENYTPEHLSPSASASPTRRITGWTRVPKAGYSIGSAVSTGIRTSATHGKPGNCWNGYGSVRRRGCAH